MKKIVSVFLAVLIIFSLSGCMGANHKSPEEITSYLTSELDMQGLTEVSGETLSHYFGFTKNSVSEFSFLVTEDDVAQDMVAAFKYSSSDAKKLIIDGIGNYFSKNADVLKDNMTVEYIKVQSRILYEYNDIIILVVCSNTEAAKTALNQLGANELK